MRILRISNCQELQLPRGVESSMSAVARFRQLRHVQKLEPLLVSMSFPTKAVDLAAGRIEGGKQSGGAVASVVVGHGLAASALQRESGLGTIQGSDFLVHAQHQNVFGRVQIQAHDVFQFFRELRIVADLETVHPVRFQAETAPDPTHAGLADPHRCRQTARAPVGSERLRTHCSEAACWPAGKAMAGAIRIHDVSCLLGVW